jgi:hypothetical protein
MGFVEEGEGTNVGVNSPWLLVIFKITQHWVGKNTLRWNKMGNS